MLPAEMSNLSQLKVLNISNNKLARIPVVLASMPSLEKVQLQGNQFVALVERQLEQITDANRIRQYLIDLAEGSRIWPECKVLILGQEVLSFLPFFDLILTKN